MLKWFTRKGRGAAITLAGFLLLYFGLPSDSRAYASNGMPPVAQTLMIGVFIGAGLIFAAFVFLVYKTGRKNRRP